MKSKLHWKIRYGTGTTEKDTVLHGSKWEMVGQGRDPAGAPRSTCGKRRLNSTGEYRVTRRGQSTASRSFGARTTQEKLGK